MKLIFLRHQIIKLYMQGASQNQQLRIRHTPQLGLNFRQCGPADVPTESSAPGGQHLLCEFLLVPDFTNLWTNDILFLRHAPILELDCTEFCGVIGSNIGAIVREPTPHSVVLQEEINYATNN